MENQAKSIDARLLSLLACSKCHNAVLLLGQRASCTSCGSQVFLRDGVIATEDFARHSYFDNVFEVMQEGNREQGTWELFYRQQASHVGESLHPEEVVIDIGCGPKLPYDKKGAFVIGVDASFHSIRANSAVDLGVYASAAALPLRTAIADAVVCFYSLHHMTGNTVAENHDLVRGVFREFARVLKTSGRLMIFDVSPRWPFGTAEDLSWNAAKKVLGSGLDMYFWTKRNLIELGKEHLPEARLKLQRYAGSPFQTFPPIFSKPFLRLPRILYPFNICLYEWAR